MCGVRWRFGVGEDTGVSATPSTTSPGGSGEPAGGGDVAVAAVAGDLAQDAVRLREFRAGQVLEGVDVASGDGLVVREHVLGVEVGESGAVPDSQVEARRGGVQWCGEADRAQGEGDFDVGGRTGVGADGEPVEQLCGVRAEQELAPDLRVGGAQQFVGVVEQIGRVGVAGPGCGDLLLGPVQRGQLRIDGVPQVIENRDDLTGLGVRQVGAGIGGGCQDGSFLSDCVGGQVYSRSKRSA